MIQVGTKLNVIDNSGARSVLCIKVYKGYKRRYAFAGDLILITIKSIRLKRRAISKTKKGEMYRALVIKTKIPKKDSFGNSFFFLENSVVLLNKQNKILGTRIFGLIPNFFRYTKYLKLVALSSGTTK